MAADEPSRSVSFTAEFGRNIRRLSKRYSHILEDLQTLFNEFEEGRTPGDRIPGVGFAVFKVRVKNSDAKRGKSGGYRWYLPGSRRGRCCPDHDL